MQSLKIMARAYVIWMMGLFLFVLFVVVLDSVLPYYISEGTASSTLMIVSYILTGFFLYHLGIKNLPNGKLKAQFWFLVGFSPLYSFGIANSINWKYFHKLDRFVVSLQD